MSPATPDQINLAYALEDLLQRHHQGAADGLTAKQLAARFTCSERDVRHAVVHLRTQGKPIGAQPKSGYYWCVSAAELEATYEFLKARMVRTALQMSKLKNIALPDIFGQLQIDLTPTLQKETA